MQTTAAERTHLCHYMREMLGGGFRGPAHNWHREHKHEIGSKEFEPLAIFFCHVEVKANPELYPPWIEQFEIEPTEPWVPPAETTESFRARIAEAKSELRKLGLGDLVKS